MSALGHPDSLLLFLMTKSAIYDVMGDGKSTTTAPISRPETHSLCHAARDPAPGNPTQADLPPT